MTWDADNPVSLRRSVRAARESARSIREVLSLDVWEAINELYLWLGEPRAPRRVRARPRRASTGTSARATQLCLGPPAQHDAARRRRSTSSGSACCSSASARRRGSSTCTTTRFAAAEGGTHHARRDRALAVAAARLLRLRGVHEGARRARHRRGGRRVPALRGALPALAALLPALGLRAPRAPSARPATSIRPRPAQARRSAAPRSTAGSRALDAASSGTASTTSSPTSSTKPRAICETIGRGAPRRRPRRRSGRVAQRRPEARAMPNLIAMSFEGDLAPCFDLRCLQPGTTAPRRLGHRLLPGRRAVGLGAQGAGAAPRQRSARRWCRPGSTSSSSIFLLHDPRRALGQHHRRQHPAVRAELGPPRLAVRPLPAASTSASRSRRGRALRAGRLDRHRGASSASS